MDGVDWSCMNWNRVDGCAVGNDGCRMGYDRSRVGYDGSRVGYNWGWVGNWSWVSNTLVFDISHITAVSSSISVIVHNLDAAIWQGHPVVSSHGCTIRGLVLAKVDA